MLTTDHSSLRLSKTLVTGLISQREVNKCSSYIDILSKFLRACFNFYNDQIDAIYIPLDFLVSHSARLTTEKVKKLVFKTIHLLKQIIYEVSIQQATHIAAYSVAANKSLSTEESATQTGNSAKKIKTVVFSLSEKCSEKDKEVKELIV